MSKKLDKVNKFNNGKEVQGAESITVGEIYKLIEANKASFEMRLKVGEGYNYGEGDVRPIHFGGIWGIVYYLGDRWRISSSYGICHGGLGYVSYRGYSSVVVSMPFTGRDKAFSSSKLVNKYPEGFLDSYYTWLTTESPVRNAFIEDWSGEFLLLDASTPLPVLMLALIMSRFPTEQYDQRGGAELFVKTYEKCKDFSVCIALLVNMLSGQYYTDPVTKHRTPIYSPLEGGVAGGAHAPLTPKYITDEGLHSFLTNKCAVERAKKKNYLPYNGCTNWGGVFDLYVQGKGTFYTNLYKKYVSTMGVKDSNPGHWNNVRTVSNPMNQDETLDFCINMFNEFKSKEVVK